MYVPGKLKSPDDLLVDVGTGFYVKKNRAAAGDVMDTKTKFVKEKADEVQRLTELKARQLSEVNSGTTPKRQSLPPRDESQTKPRGKHAAAHSLCAAQACLGLLQCACSHFSSCSCSALPEGPGLRSPEGSRWCSTYFRLSTQPRTARNTTIEEHSCMLGASPSHVGAGSHPELTKGAPWAPAVQRREVTCCAKNEKRPRSHHRSCKESANGFYIVCNQIA